MNKLLDMTYWRFKRWRRRCVECGNGRDDHLGKVNYAFSFEPKRYWHYKCLVIERRRRGQIK